MSDAAVGASSSRNVAGDHYKYGSIQCLRAVAALAVFALHIKLIDVGYAGVDIFFVISGFIMGAMAAGEAPAAFLRKRLIRIVPLYWCATLAMCAMSLIPGLFSRFTFDAVSLVKSLLFVPFADQATAKVWPLLIPGWSLNYEIFFYVVFAIGLALRRPIILTSLAMIGLVVAGLLVAPASAVPFTYTNPLLLEFVGGLAISQVPVRLLERYGGLLLLFGSVALAIGCWAAGRRFDDQVMGRVIYFGAPALLIIAGAIGLERKGLWPRMGPLEFIGDASYSLYLTHTLVVDFVLKFAGVPMGLRTMLATVLCLAVAAASYRLFEVPVSRLLRGHGLPWKLFGDRRRILIP